MIIYKYDTQTKEFIQELEINEAYGTNLPFTTTIKPLANKDGFAICFNGTKWEYVEDNRNKTIYVKDTKEELKVDYLGKIKDEHTLLIPKQFDKWDYKLNKWIEDVEAKESYRINDINNKARTIIYSKYPQEKQSSASLGIYGDEYLATMKSFIKQVIDISNKAIDDKIPADEVDWKAVNV